MAATVEESTPPDMATAMVRFGIGIQLLALATSRYFASGSAVTMPYSNKSEPALLEARS